MPGVVIEAYDNDDSDDVDEPNELMAVVDVGSAVAIKFGAAVVVDGLRLRKCFSEKGVSSRFAESVGSFEWFNSDDDVEFDGSAAREV